MEFLRESCKKVRRRFVRIVWRFRKVNESEIWKLWEISHLCSNFNLLKIWVMNVVASLRNPGVLKKLGGGRKKWHVRDPVFWEIRGGPKKWKNVEISWKKRGSNFDQILCFFEKSGGPQKSWTGPGKKMSGIWQISGPEQNVFLANSGKIVPRVSCQIDSRVCFFWKEERRGYLISALFPTFW